MIYIENTFLYMYKYIFQALDGHYYETEEKYQKMIEQFRKDSKLFRYTEVEGKHHVHMTHPEIISNHINIFLEDSSNL